MSVKWTPKKHKSESIFQCREKHLVAVDINDPGPPKEVFRAVLL